MSCDCQQCGPAEIVRLVQAGDAAALDRITRCYGKQLLAVGQRVCGDPDSARDAVQDALLAAGQHLDQFRGDGSVEGWLAQMVANACRTRLRGRKHQPAYNQELSDDAAISGASSPDGDAARAELGEALRAALEELSPTDRAVVLLTQVDGWRGPEVAAALELSPEAVRTRLTRSRQRLRELLGAVWDEWSEAGPE